jgi:hypothetical protein
MNDKSFWIIYSSRGNPTQFHNDLSEAEREAERLSLKHPGVKFYVAYIHSYYLGECKSTRHDF